MALIDKLTDLADEIREIDGTTDKISLIEMSAKLQSANTEIAEHTELIEQIKGALEGKAGGSGGGVGPLKKYAKIIATPTSQTSFVITNPLGGIAKKVSARRKTDVATSSRRCQVYLADFDVGFGAAMYIDTSGTAKYVVQKTEGTVNNGYFKATEGTITLYRYNSANVWDNTAEYEVEIYE